MCGALIKKLPDDTTVIGSAGTFEVLSKVESPAKMGTISRQQFLQVHDQIIAMDLETRQNTDQLPPERARYIVTALILVKYLFDSTECNEILVSRYALKEGLIVDF
jgi:exopolyphosphatase/pppGpp-phosphohydrolase